MSNITLSLLNGNTTLWQQQFSQTDNTELTIGRVDTCQIKIDENNVSRQHAKVLIRNGSVFICDTQSANGTYLNGSKTRLSNQQYIPLNNNDSLQFATNNSYRLVVSIQTQAANPNPVPNPQPNPKPDASGVVHSLDEMFKRKNEVTIGREESNDVVLASLLVSRKHATIRKISDANYLVIDNNSSNGTFVNGQRLKGQTNISTSDIVSIGKNEFRFINNQMSSVFINNANFNAIAIEAKKLEKVYANGKKVLYNVSFSINKGEFIAIMGPSGCGKSTLLKTINGENPATNGSVKLWGYDLRTNYEYLKKRIGYVPQDDIVHRDLTVDQSLYYAAQLRLSSDVSDDEINKKITEILTDLNLNDPKLRSTLVSGLSGGQRKRVSIAVELLTDPEILFLDEPTSPLDPETIESFLDALTNLATQKQTTIFMVTHKPDDLAAANRIIFLAKDGYLTYFGKPQDLMPHFGKQKVSDIYAANKEVKDGQYWANIWQQKYAQSITDVHQPKEKLQRGSESLFSQYYWLTKRYASIKSSNTSSLLLLIGQAPVIALLMCFIFSQITLSVLFFTAVCAIWFGTSNAAKEIVDELPIYKRERMFNLRIMPYLLSKITILTLVSVAQVVLFIGILYINFNFVSKDTSLNIRFPFLVFAQLMLFLSFSGTLMGLFLSAYFDNSEKVMTFLPLILIPQIMLSGVVAPISNPLVEAASYTQIARWGVDAFASKIDTIRYYKPVHVDVLGQCNVSQSQQPICFDANQNQQTPTTAYFFAQDTLRDKYLPIAATENLNVKNTLMESIDDRDNLFNAKLLMILLIDGLVFFGIFHFLRKKDAV